MHASIPSGMSRRHFMTHMAGASALAIPALSLTNSLRVHAADLKRNHKAAILLWMSGGPSTMDIWDLKPGQPTAGEFQPISTAGDVQICEHMPMQARMFDRFAAIRSIVSVDEHSDSLVMTGYSENTNRAQHHPSFGAVLSKLRGTLNADIPPYVSLRGMAPVTEPGFLCLGCCSHHVTAEQFAAEAWAGIREAGRGGRLIRSAGAGPDHPIHPALPETAYLKFLAYALD